ncbi:AAA ATPase [Treponema primitia ZAS-2]|uniref:AAA ATPase n=1 Tax=Treponema primitia (strain ATCC BAA-887 / DSM 12427 / ZAS-2) TaxID=545694 RepID=F5YI91_TREPZ|nr:AAA family ATPase [Treponema primitia]AEF83946.1 AAA ATPase [Treponema primitia ZAS-2]
MADKISIKINQDVPDSQIKKCEFKLPYFTILTGKNGTGKTHLIEAINNQNCTIVNANDGKICQKIKYIKFAALRADINEVYNSSEIHNVFENIKNSYDQALVNHPNNPEPIDIINETVGNLCMNFGYSQNKINNLTTLFEKAILSSGGNFRKLNIDYISENFDVTLLENNNDLFIANITGIFSYYHRMEIVNKLKKIEATEKRYSKNFYLSDREFVQKYGKAPWDSINTVLSVLELPYMVTKPEQYETDFVFHLKLKDISTGIEISPSKLSTGEQVLMSLAMAKYNSGRDFEKIDLLLIDEPDAGLHPSMSKKMIEILKRDIVDSGIPVIISSHSPTTIVAADNENIYEKERGISIPKQSTIQEAIEILTKDIPFLEVSMNQTRQIFVESEYDASSFDKISHIFCKNLNSLNLVFLPTKGKKENGANCENVKFILNRCKDNPNIYGIIDGDAKREQADNSKLLILGNGKRYAIENYILDPLLMGLWFIKIGKREPLHFDLTFSSYAETMNNLDEISAQKIINKVLTDIEMISGEKVTYLTFNNWTLSITNVFCKCQGHEAEGESYRKYDFLNPNISQYKGDYLKKEVIKSIWTDCYQYSPKEIYDTLKNIR